MPGPWGEDGGRRLFSHCLAHDFHFLAFFFLLITRLCSFSCQGALLLIELQPLVAVSQTGSKGSGDWPCNLVPEHVTSQFLPISTRNFEVSAGVHSKNILCQGYINVLYIILFNNF